MTTPNTVFDERLEHSGHGGLTPAQALIERAMMLIGGWPAELARRLEVTPSHISRLRKGTAGLSIEACVRLANVLDEDHLLILRLGGHTRLCEMLAFRRQRGMAPSRARLHELLDRLSHRDRLLVGRLIERLLGESDAEEPAVAALVPANVDAPRRGLR
jgi:plasmid maintenance system antidote protein VapI